MRFKLLIGLLIVLIGVLFGSAYHDYNLHKTVVTKEQTTEQQVNAQLVAQRKANSDLVTKYNALWEQCNTGFAAWQELTPTINKLNIKAPDCGLAILE